MSDNKKVDVISQEPTEVKYLIGDAKDKVAKAYSMLIADNDIPDWEPIAINVVIGQLNSTTNAIRTFSFTSKDSPRDVLDGIIGHINTFNHDKKQFETGVADDLFTDVEKLSEKTQDNSTDYAYTTLANELSDIVETWKSKLDK